MSIYPFTNIEEARLRVNTAVQSVCPIPFSPRAQRVNGPNILTEHFILHAYPPAKQIFVRGAMCGAATQFRATFSDNWVRPNSCSHYALWLQHLDTNSPELSRVLPSSVSRLQHPAAELPRSKSRDAPAPDSTKQNSKLLQRQNLAHRISPIQTFVRPLTLSSQLK